MAAKKRTKKKATAKTRKARIPKTWAQMARMMDRVGKKFDTIPKSKKRGLSGSPAEHAQSAERHMDDLDYALDQSDSFMGQGDCRNAIFYLKKAHQHEGAVDADALYTSSKFSTMIRQAFDLKLDTVETKFRNKCLVKKARALSGMRRRKKR